MIHIKYLQLKKKIIKQNQSFGNFVCILARGEQLYSTNSLNVYGMLKHVARVTNGHRVLYM